MAVTEQFSANANDFLLVQAERVFTQRQTRRLVIDPDILGEPGWDILLCAYIAFRKGSPCRSETVANEIGLSAATTKRWIDILTERDLLIQEGGHFAISIGAEAKLSGLFSRQINEALQAYGLPTNKRGGDHSEA